MDNKKNNNDNFLDTEEVENEEKENIKENNIEKVDEEETEEKENSKENNIEKVDEEETEKKEISEENNIEKVDEEETKEKENSEENTIEEVNEKEISEKKYTDDINVEDIKIEEIDLESIKKELKEKEYNKEKLEKELEILEKNILKQSDIFETDIMLEAILKSRDNDSDSGDLISNNINDVKVDSEKKEIGQTHNIKVKKKKTHNKAMSKVLVAVTVVFMALIMHIVYYVLVDSKTRLNNEYNERSLLLEETVVRGNIYSSDNKILAQTIKDEDVWIRHYPYGSLFAHTVGRYDKGKTGIELANDFSLVTTQDTTIQKIINDINDEKSMGNSVVTTLQYNLQKIAYDALGNKKGAVVAIEPSTGKILAMVSKPSYDPNFISKNWSVLSNVDNSKNSLVNRATQGLYPPGSTFKIVTSLAYMRYDNIEEFQYVCKGTEKFNGYIMQCYDGKIHEDLNIISAFALSCNGAFGKLGTIVGKKKLNYVAETLFFNKKISYDYAYNMSSFKLLPNDDETMMAQTAIGQGNTKITPLHNALIVSAVANNGVMMKPYMVDRIIDGDSNIVEITKSRKMGDVMSTKETQTLKEMMINVVEDGTAIELSNIGVRIAGKTGSAEYDNEGNSHAWFVGYAPVHAPKIAISIIVENGGTGAETAVPIAKKLFLEYLK